MKTLLFIGLFIFFFGFLPVAFPPSVLVIYPIGGIFALYIGMKAGSNCSTSISDEEAAMMYFLQQRKKDKNTTDQRAS